MQGLHPWLPVVVGDAPGVAVGVLVACRRWSSRLGVAGTVVMGDGVAVAEVKSVAVAVGVGVGVLVTASSVTVISTYTCSPNDTPSLSSIIQ